MRRFESPARLQSLPLHGATRAVQALVIDQGGLISRRNLMPLALEVAGVEPPPMPIEVKTYMEQGMP